MQLSRTKFQKSFILSTKKWIKGFPGKNPVNSREKSGDITPTERFFAVILLCTANSRSQTPCPRESSFVKLLCRILGADLLIGAQAVVFNPHFQHFFRVSPEAKDLELGCVQFWPAIPALLLLDSFAPTERAQILAHAATHCSLVWVLPQDQQSVTAASDLISLSRFQLAVTPI